MRRTVVFALLAVCVAVSGGSASAAAEHAIALTASGPQPSTLTVRWGDSAVFTNTTSAPVTLLIPRLSVTEEIAAGATFTRVFDVRAGAYPIRQRIVNKATVGTITVDASGTITLKATPATVVFGKPVALAGTSSFGDTPVDIETRIQGVSSTWQKVTTVSPGADGSFTAALSIERGLSVSVSTAGQQLRSASVALTVVPVLKASIAPRRVTTGTFLKITGSIRPLNSLSSVLVERYDADRKRWTRFRTVSIPRSGRIAVSARATKGANRFRLFVPRGAVRPGFAAPAPKGLSAVGT